MGICNRCNKYQRYSVQKYKFQSVDLFWEGNWKKLPIPWPFNMQLYSFSTIFVLPYQIHHRNLLRFSMTFEMVATSRREVSADYQSRARQTGGPPTIHNSRYPTLSDKLVTLISFCWFVMSLFSFKLLKKKSLAQ